MKAVFFYFFLAIAYVISILPFFIIHILSDILYLLAFYIIGYRKKVVIDNLTAAFPEKTPNEIHLIAKKYYRHLADLIFENIATLTMNEKNHHKRYRYKNPQILHDLYNENRNVILMTAHYGNWEWQTIFPKVFKHKQYAVYKSLNNRYFNDLVIRFREKFGTKTVNMTEVLKTAIKISKGTEPSVIYSLSDQSPRKREIRFWTKFLNLDTAFYTGNEKIAKKYNFAVVYMSIQKVKRSFYEIEFRLVTKNPKTTAEAEITNSYVSHLENDIKNNPEFWLWSHRRWKYKKDHDFKS